MGQAAVALMLGKQGRIVIPAVLRRELGFEEGAELVAHVDGGRLILEPRSAVAARLQDCFAKIPGSLADELIKERRQEAGEESTLYSEAEK